VKWVKSLSCFLLVEVRLQWVRFLKVFLVWCLKLGSRSMTWNLRGKVVRMIISLDYKSASLKTLLQSLLVVCVNHWHSWVLVPCVLLSSCVQFSPTRHWSHCPTQTEKEQPKFSSDSSVGKQPKNRSRSLLDTSPLWETSPSFPAFWDFTLARPQEDE